MKLNVKRLVENNIFLYDIEACHTNILKKFNIDIESDNKIERNIKIGMLMKNNSNLVYLLRTSTKSQIDKLMLFNNLTQDDIIAVQYDGILTYKKLNIPDDMKLKIVEEIYPLFITGIDRDCYISKTVSNDIKVKGVPKVFSSILPLYKKILNFNFINREVIFNQIQNFITSLKDLSKENFIFDENNHKVIVLKEFGKIEFTDSNIFDIDLDIDVNYYLRNYFEVFLKSIIVEFF